MSPLNKKPRWSEHLGNTDYFIGVQLKFPTATKTTRKLPSVIVIIIKGVNSNVINHHKQFPPFNLMYDTTTNFVLQY